MSKIKAAAGAAVLYGRQRDPLPIPFEQIGAIDVAARELLCITLDEPSGRLLDELTNRLGLDPRGMAEIERIHRRPRLAETASYTLLGAVTVSRDGTRLHFGEQQLLIGKGFLIIIRRGSGGSHADLPELVHETPELLERGSDFVATAVLDRIIDAYADTLEEFEDGVEHLEREFLLHALSSPDVRELYRHRRDLLRLHGALAPLGEICRRLSRVEMPYIDADCRPYFAEAADRLIHLENLIDGLRQALAFAFEAGLMIGQSQQTDITKKLAAWAAILAIPTAVAGIYGMNFKHMRELDWTYGYGLIMSLTALVCMGLFIRFRKLRWL